VVLFFAFNVLLLGLHFLLELCLDGLKHLNFPAITFDAFLKVLQLPLQNLLFRDQLRNGSILLSHCLLLGSLEFSILGTPQSCIFPILIDLLFQPLLRHLEICQQRGIGFIHLHNLAFKIRLASAQVFNLAFLACNVLLLHGGQLLQLRPNHIKLTDSFLKGSRVLLP